MKIALSSLLIIILFSHVSADTRPKESSDRCIIHHSTGHGQSKTHFLATKAPKHERDTKRFDLVQPVPFFQPVQLSCKHTNHQVTNHESFRELSDFPTLCAFLVPLCLRGKSSKAAMSNRMIIHLNKSFFVSGEVIWYKIYFPANFEGKNIALRVGLWDREGNMLESVFHKTHGKAFVQGHYNIPFEFKSGLYHFLVLGTNRATNEPVQLAQASIPIYNDLEKEEQPPLIIQPELATDIVGFLHPKLKVSVALLSETIQRRGKVKAKIQIRNEKGEPIIAGLSVSVRDNTLTAVNIPGQQNIIEGKLLEPKIGSTLDSSIAFVGRLSDSLGQALQAPLFGIYSSKEQTFAYTKSDKAGRFPVKLPDFYGSKPIQFMDYQYEDIDVVLRSEIPLEKKGDLVYTPQILTYLEASRQRKKIFQLYNTFEYELEPAITAFESQSFEPDNSFQIQNYERFASIPVFFKEVVTPLKFRKDTSGRFIAKMFNPAADSRNYYPGKPIFIVDGKLTRDADFIAALDITQIERVDLFYNFEKLRQRFNVLGIHGVVVIETNQPDLRVPTKEEEDIFLIHGLQAQVPFPGLHQKEKAIEAHSPFLQPQLYWNPNLQTDTNGEVELEFMQSDDLSTFKIEVMVQGQNGAWGYGALTYRVYP